MDLLTSLIYVCWQPHNMENKSCILCIGLFHLTNWKFLNYYPKVKITTNWYTEVMSYFCLRIQIHSMGWWQGLGSMLHMKKFFFFLGPTFYPSLNEAVERWKESKLILCYLAATQCVKNGTLCNYLFKKTLILNFAFNYL